MVKLKFFKITGWISTIKISQDVCNFSESDLEKQFRFSILLRSPDKLIMPRIEELSGGKPLKSRCKAIFSFYVDCKKWTITFDFTNGQKMCRWYWTVSFLVSEEWFQLYARYQKKTCDCVREKCWTHVPESFRNGYYFDPSQLHNAVGHEKMFFYKNEQLIPLKLCFI